MQSFARGGLAAGWGAAVPPYSDADLHGWPLTRQDLQPHYDAVTRRIGISGTESDDLAGYFGPSPGLLPPARLDSNGEWILATYQRRARFFHSRGLYAGRPRLAIATKRYRHRGPLAYHDMEFWADADRAVYRPGYTLSELQRAANLRYESGVVIDSFAETNGGVRLSGRRIGGGEFSIDGAHVILAAGTLQSTRIVLKSVAQQQNSVPLLSNPYSYFPCLLWTRIGQPTLDRRHSLTQAMMYFDPHHRPANAIQVQFYSYRSLLQFKLLKESPYGIGPTTQLLRHLLPMMVIAGVHHADYPTAHKRAFLSGNGGLRIEYQPSLSERRRRTKIENDLGLLFYRMGLYPLRRIDPGHGSSIHYAGTLPMSTSGAPLTTSPDGRLADHPRIRLADGSAFPTLPAKGLTFTLMANANRVGSALAKDLS
jgi:choline dehydrogenase-like flavoprotein